MKQSFKTGLNFGITSGIITTLGLMIGLYAGTYSRMVVISGIMTIAVADSFSDALGIHLSEESKSKNSKRKIWEATLATFLSKLFFTLTFVPAFFIFSLKIAIIANIFWGFACLGLLSWHMATKNGHKKAWSVIGEHILIATVVIILAHLISGWIRIKFI